jgi:hypothetical protein
MYHHKHRAHWESNEQNWDRVLAMDVFANWELPDPLPAVRVEGSSLVLALECFCAGDTEHGAAFCRQAISVANRIIAEDRCTSNPVAEAGYPKNLAEVLRGRAYAQWLLGAELDRAEMRRVGEHLATWCLTKATDFKRFHRSMTMSVYLDAVRAAMVACDLDYAVKLLKTKHKFRWHHAGERDLWTRLIAVYPDIGPDLRQELEVFFDRVRDPDFDEFEWGEFGRKIRTFINREILALETGIIRQMYVVNASALDPVDPKAVIEAVAR